MSTLIKRKLPIVLVVWEDACHSTGYYDKSSPDRPMGCQTVGHLLESKPTYINVAVERFEDGALRHIHTIPRRMVKRMVRLTEKNSRGSEV